MENYTQSYHLACSWLIHRGAFGGDAHERKLARSLIAVALLEQRQLHGRKRACQERYHLKQIAGMFPVKGWLPAD